MPDFLNELYFAYGSNLNVSQMAQRCPAAVPHRGLRVNDWRLVFRRVADLEPAAGQQVVGGLWKVTRACEQALDRYEGIHHGLYRKVLFRLPAGEIAFMYLMNGGGRDVPPAYYYDAILTGYGDWGFDVKPLRYALIEASAESRRRGPPDDIVMGEQLIYST